MYKTTEISVIKNYMLRHRQTLCVAESVTSGHLQAALSLAEGATEFFQGGITTYNLGQKSRHLKVEPISASAFNCVSKKITEEMAIHALELFSSNWAIATTGYAAPVPELGIKGLYAFYSIAFRGKIVRTKKITSRDQGIYDTQVFYTNTTLQELSKYLRSSGKR